MALRNIHLTDPLDNFVAELVASGQFQNASEVVGARLRLLKSEEEHRAAKLARRRAAVQEGLDAAARGEGIPLVDVKAHFRQIQGEIDAELEAEAKTAAAE